MDLIILRGENQIGPLNILEVADMFERGEVSLDDNVIVPPDTKPQTLEQLVKQQSYIIQSAFGVKSEEYKQMDEQLERGIAVEKALRSMTGIKKAIPEIYEYFKESGFKKHSSWSREDVKAIDVAKDLYERSERKEMDFMVVREGDEYVFYTLTESNSQATQNKGCFIATAAYGSSLAPEVVFLSRFRDEFLVDSKLGALFVGFYYYISPPLASLIAKVDFLRVTTRIFFLTPILRLLKIWMFKN